MKTIYSISKKAGLLLSFLLLAVSLMAQNSIHVKGVVKDPVGEAIIGASVVVKGTTMALSLIWMGILIFRMYLREQ